MVTLTEAAAIGSRDRYLAVISTVRADGTIQSSVVNAGLLAHPVSGGDVVAFVTYGRAKLRNLRARPQVTVTFRAGFQWAAVEGLAQIAGPDDRLPGIDDERLRLLRREVFTAAGGSHDDWQAYDEVMAAERRAVVLVAPTRLYSNRPQS
jgi:PPOX class probable F420-dependent enzyme